MSGALVAVLATLESAVDNANALGKNKFRFPLLFIRTSEQNLNLMSTEAHQDKVVLYISNYFFISTENHLGE